MTSSRDGLELPLWLEQLEAIAERVGGEDAVVPRQGLVLGDRRPRLAQAHDEAAEIADEQRGCAFRAGRKSASTPRCTFTALFSNHGPPRRASSVGFATSGIPSSPW